jgi:uroporphyrinogen decarboxylase
MKPMTGRERFRRTFSYGRPDHVPYFEEGLRDDVLGRWHRQGLPRDADLAEMFHTDRRERIAVNLAPLPKMTRRPTTRRSLDALRRRLDPDDPRRLPKDWSARVRAWRRRGHVLELPIVHGLFLTLGADTWRTVTAVLCELCDSPALLRETLEVHGEFAARIADRVLAEVDCDFVSFSEPIGGNNGPLLSPRQYEEFVLAGYRPILDVLRRRRVRTICFITYANARALIPSVLAAGFNCLWACEVNVRAMDYRSLRREFGRDLRLIGGIDLDVLLRDKRAIRREIMTKVPPLLAEGGYIPLADGRVRVNVPFENYVYYRRMIEELTSHVVPRSPPAPVGT